MKDAVNEIGWSFRACDLVLLLILLVALLALLAPALAQSRENSNEASCVNNAKEIAIALQNHHDTRKSFPLASTRFITSKPGEAGNADAAGYSWLTMLLPYMEQYTQYDKLARSSNKFQKDLYDSTVTSKDGADELPSRELEIKEFLCPSFLAGRQDGSAARPDAGRRGLADKQSGVSNYHALSGSHFFNKDGVGRLLPDKMLDKQANGRVLPKSAYEGDGVIVFPGQVGGKQPRAGISMIAITDGTSRTVVFAETIESEFASWIDGQDTWLVATWPGTPDVPQLVPSQKVPGLTVLEWTAEQLPKNWISFGHPSARIVDDEKVVYLPAARWSAGKDRKWGPSSYHVDRAVHAFADASVRMIKDDIDKNVYLHLVTRNGREADDRNSF